MRVTIKCPMNIRLGAWLIVVSLTFLRNSEGQSFTNLDFEDATIVLDTSSPNYPHDVYTVDAIPGWATTGCFLGPTEITYNTLPIFAPDIAILGTNGGTPPLDGNFTIELYGGVSDAGVSISQTGLVPANTASIRFLAQPPDPLSGGPLLVSLGGQNISFSAISTGPNYTFYGGNIPSALTGQISQLTFTVPVGAQNYWEIDDIQFSSSPVPEPSALGLLALGGLFFRFRSSK